MSVDKEYHERREYFSELIKIKSEVEKILEVGDEEEISRAVKYYPEKLNHLLVKRNLKSLTVLLPFIDLPIVQERTQNVNLIDLNIKKEDIELLNEIIQKILMVLEEV